MKLASEPREMSPSSYFLPFESSTHVPGIERIVVRDGMLEIVHLTEFPLRNGRLILLDGRLALQGIRLRLKGMHLITKRRNRGIRCINPLP